MVDPLEFCDVCHEPFRRGNLRDVVVEGVEESRCRECLDVHKLRPVCPLVRGLKHEQCLICFGKGTAEPYRIGAWRLGGLPALRALPR